LFAQAGGPLDADDIHVGGVGQAKVRVGSLAKPDSAGDFPKLPSLFSAEERLETNLCPDSVAIGSRADATNLEPGIGIAVVAIEKIGTAALPVGDKEIQESVVVVVGPRPAGRVAPIIH